MPASYYLLATIMLFISAIIGSNEKINKRYLSDNLLIISGILLSIIFIFVSECSYFRETFSNKTLGVGKLYLLEKFSKMCFV